MPTPALSFAVRRLGCQGGVVTTASHNPASYNGYKVYGPDGCQITGCAAAEIAREIESIDPFRDVRAITLEEGLSNGMIRSIPDSLRDAYLEAVSAQSLLDCDTDRGFPIVYTLLHGVGISCVPQCLLRNGFPQIFIPPAQEEPDGDFPTCPYPNPEEPAALRVGLEHARRTGAELLLATDPDCDRMGTAVRHEGGYVLLTGNQMGALLLDFVCRRRAETGRMPPNPIAIKTIVTTPLAHSIAREYGVLLVNVSYRIMIRRGCRKSRRTTISAPGSGF